MQSSTRELCHNDDVKTNISKVRYSRRGLALLNLLLARKVSKRNRTRSPWTNRRKLSHSPRTISRRLPALRFKDALIWDLSLWKMTDHAFHLHMIIQSCPPIQAHVRLSMRHLKRGKMKRATRYHKLHLFTHTTRNLEPLMTKHQLLV